MFEIKRSKRKVAGKSLFNFISRYRKELKEAKNLGTLYVSKDERTKGEKSFNKDEFENFREIKFMKNKEFREICGKFVNKWAGQFKHNLEAQYGFIPSVGIKDLIREKQRLYKENKIVYAIDLSNAFCQVSEKQIYFYLRKALFINKEDAKLLSESMSYKGFLYQGHPLSPIFFNLHINKSILRLKNICDGIIAYADDITLFFRRYLSRKIKTLICKILKENNLILNNKKSKIKLIKGGITGLGFTFLNGKFIAKNLSKLKRLIKYFDYKTHNKIIPNKSNNVKLFEQKAKGIENFIKDIQSAAYDISSNKKYRKIYQGNLL